jgi:predicted RNase H-like HicB family nuclease
MCEPEVELVVTFDDYKVVLYRNQPEGWVAEIPAIPGCYALMDTREEALEELKLVFGMISDEYRERREELPLDTTEFIHA